MHFQATTVISRLKNLFNIAGGGAGVGGSTKLYTHLFRFVKNITSQ